jgi:predicted SnoaL-like aldol condensation-catalyzing enzyme
MSHRILKTTVTALALVSVISAIGCSSSESTGGSGGSSSASGSSGTGGAPASSPAANKKLVEAAFDAAFGAKDPGALDTYFSSTFIRHNPTAKSDGTGELKGLLKGLPPSFSYTRHRAFASGDYVVLHSTYDGLFGPGIKAVGFDLVKIAGGKIAEHWDCLQVDPGKYVSAHTMVDGPTAVDASASSADATSALSVGKGGLIDVFFLGNNPAMKQLTDFLAPTYIQHDPLVGDGLKGLMDTFGKAPFDTVKFHAVQLTVVEGDFAFGRSKMTWNDPSIPDSKDDPAVSCDLFRVKGGLLVEHWDVLQTDPNSRGKTFDTLGKNGAGHTMFE